MILAAAITASPMVLGSATSASAQAFCRFDDTGQVCVCRRGGRWFISPGRACRARFDRPPPPRAYYDERDDYDDDAYYDDYYDEGDPRDEADYRDELDYRDEADYRDDEVVGRYDSPAPPRSSTAADPRERAEIADIQRVLNALGCGAGTADGVVGSQTRSAIRCFQRRADQTVTGRLTIDERDALLDASATLPRDGRLLLGDLRADLGAPAETIADDAASDETFAADEILEEDFAAEEIAEEDFAAEEIVEEDFAEEEIVEEDFAEEEIVEEEIAEEAIAEEEDAVDAGPIAEASPEDEPIGDALAGFPGDAAEEAPATEVAATEPAERCDSGFSSGGWTYRAGRGDARVTASAQTQDGALVDFEVRRNAVSWVFDVTIRDAAYVATVIETAQYLFIQTDQPAAIGFEDVSEFDGQTLRIPVGEANTGAMLDSGDLTLAAAARNATSDGRLTLFDLATVETRGLGATLDCLRAGSEG